MHRKFIVNHVPSEHWHQTKPAASQRAFPPPGPCRSGLQGTRVLGRGLGCDPAHAPRQPPSHLLSFQAGVGHPGRPPGCPGPCGHTTSNDKMSLPAEAHHHTQKHLSQFFFFIYKKKTNPEVEIQSNWKKVSQHSNKTSLFPLKYNL